MGLYDGKTVMVAGGAGFIGSQMVRSLRDEGAEVHVLDSLLHGSYEHIPVDDAIYFTQVDALNEEALRQAYRLIKPDFVFNFIGDTFIPSAYVNPRRMFRINMEANLNLLAACRDYGVERYLYVSSTEVYGHLQGSLINEDHPMLPVNTYAVSKLAADRLTHTYYLEHNVPAIIVRAFNAFGPRACAPYLIPEIISQLSRSSILSLGNIEAARDFTYVSDTCDAMMRVMLSDMVDGEAVNIGSGKSYSVQYIAEALAEIMGIDNLEIHIDENKLRRHEIMDLVADTTKLNSLIDWKPQVSFADGLKKTVNWYKKHNSQWAWEINKSRDEIWS